MGWSSSAWDAFLELLLLMVYSDEVLRSLWFCIIGEK